MPAAGTWARGGKVVGHVGTDDDGGREGGDVLMGLWFSTVAAPSPFLGSPLRLGVKNIHVYAWMILPLPMGANVLPLIYPGS